MTKTFCGNTHEQVEKWKLSCSLRYKFKLVFRRLRDKLIGEERLPLAMEVSTKCGLDTLGVWAAWGTACLHVGNFQKARTMFSRCLKVSPRWRFWRFFQKYWWEYARWWLIGTRIFVTRKRYWNFCSLKADWSCNLCKGDTLLNDNSSQSVQFVVNLRLFFVRNLIRLRRNSANVGYRLSPRIAFWDVWPPRKH